MAETSLDKRLHPLVKRRWRRPIGSRAILVTGAVLVVGYLSLGPVLYLLYGTFYDGANLTLRFFQEAYSAYGLGSMVGTSLLFAAGSTVVAMVPGTILGYLTARTDVPFKRLIFAASLVPLILPGILHTIAWIFLASPNIGVFNKILQPVFGPGFLNIFSLWGMMLVQGLHLCPLVFLLMHAAFRSMDPSLEEAALACGARLPMLLRRITLPLAKPALTAATLVMVVLGLEAFEVPALLGIPNRHWVFTTRIWQAMNHFPPQYGQAGAYAVSLLILTTVGVFWQSRLTNQARRFQTITGKAFRPRTMELGRWRWAAALFVVAYFLIAVAAPILVLLYASFQPFYSVPSLDSLKTLTFKSYEFALTDTRTIADAKNTLWLAIGSATAVMFVTAIMSWLVLRTRMRGRWILDNLTFLPLAVPGVVMGVALLFIYLRFPIPIYGSVWIIFIAFFTRFMPYGMRYASTSMFQVSTELEEAAQVSGASWWKTFRRVTLPLLAPGLTAGWIYIILVAVRELSSVILLYSPGSEVLSIAIWAEWQNGQITDVAALGVLIVAALVVLVAVAQRIGGRVGIRGS